VKPSPVITDWGNCSDWSERRNDVYTRADLSVDDRLEMFSRYWRFQDDHGTVTKLAEEFRTSHHFVYELAQRVRNAVDWRPAGRPAEDRTADEISRLRQRIRELESDCDQLTGQLELERRNSQTRRLRLVLELALAPVSEDNIVRCLEAAFGWRGRVSAGWVNEQIQRAGKAALRIRQREDICGAVKEAALDEIFRHQQPILTMVDPHTMMAVVPQAAENRKGETWKEALDQYPNLKHVVSDRGSGLLKGVELSPRRMTHQFDLFHFKRDLKRELRRLESLCYEAIEAQEKARKVIDEPRLSWSARIQARVEYRQQVSKTETMLEAFDWAEMVIAYLEESCSAYDTRRHEIRSFERAQAAVDEVLELLSEIKALNVGPLREIITGARRGLFTFLSVLQEKLELVPIGWRRVLGDRRAVCDALARCWHWRTRAGHCRECQRKYLAALIGLKHWSWRIENFTEVQEQVYAALDRVVRASSAVECLNSLLRPYVSVKKHLNQGFLALVALYWNMRPLAQRGGRTPFQLSGIDLGTDDWVELLEEKMQKRSLTPKTAA
jgi:hypothetical protein